MARLIFISPYMKGGRDAARLAHRTRYFATREGVQLLKDDTASLPPTKKQQQYIQRLLRSFPEAKELPEHEEYQTAPSRQSAFELIEQIHEDFVEPMDGRENYLDYVANRPGVKTLGEHGLWDAKGKVPSLENAVAEVAQHPGNVWTPIISLTRENAERLGYTDLENWQALIRSCITDIAKGYKIHPDHLRWYAALHEKEKHIHVHMVIFSTNPKEGYLTKQGIRKIKSALVSTIYRDERLHIYEQKDAQRSLLQREAESQMADLIAQMAGGTVQNEKLELLVAELARRLREVSGKKVYSRRGQNLVNGTVKDLHIGNTELLAAILQKLTDADSFRLEPQEDYPADYYRCIDEARQDLQRKRCPALKCLPDSIAPYDVIYLGYPNYWGTMPMPVVTFLKRFDFAGKRIKPFCTHEGSGLGRSEQDIRTLCPGAQVEPGLAIRGSEVRRELAEIEEWVQNGS